MTQISQILQATNQSFRSTLTQPVFWVAQFAAITICFLSGPFGTHEVMTPGFRLIYWTLLVMVTGTLGVWTSILVRSMNWSDLRVLALISVLFGLCVALVVIAISFALLVSASGYPGHLPMFLYSFPSAAIIFFSLSVIIPNVTGSGVPARPERPALFARLEKFSKAKDILALSAQDHYVEVTTELGSELCLIRLNDAVAETAPIEGIQTHRSHWVACHAIASIETNGTRAHVVLTNGAEIKISQSRLKDVREALKQAM